ncbi:MAG TPA: glycosyltransferase family 2 protein [Vicinamibacterales bacterium]|nr:glycosyltransferase family 2 protein [Vicinamibacterales bacterium]
MSARQTISFVIPVYRNERAITLTYQKIKGALASDLTAYDYEFVFVDDGSDDGSLEELLGLRRDDDRVKIVSFTRNFGQMAAILAGLKNATGDVILHLSADLQDPVELIPKMVRDHEGGAELVIGHRVEREDKWTSRITSRIFYRIVRMSFPSMPAGGFDFVLMARRVVDAFNRIEVRNRFFQGDLLWLGYKTSFIPYTRAKRTIGRSQYTFAKRLKNSLDAILDSSYLPIRFISVAGAVTAFLGFLYALNITYWYFTHGTPFAGWAPIMILLLIIGGVMMVMLGIIGEYIWRIYDEVKKKPNYIVREFYGEDRSPR